MSNEQTTVTYSLEQVLTRLENKIDNRFEQIDRRFEQLEQKIDNRFEQIDRRFEQLEQKIDNLQQDVTDLKVGQVRLEERFTGEIKTLDQKVDAISKRLDNIEFINRGVVVSLIIAILGGFAKVFGFFGTP